MHWNPDKINEDPKKQLELNAYTLAWTRSSKLWKCDKAKGLGLEHLIMEKRISLTRFVCRNFSQVLLFIPVIRMFLSSWSTEGIFHLRVPCPGPRRASSVWEFHLLVHGGHLPSESPISGFQQGQSALLASAVFQTPLTKNNQYDRVAYFGVVCSELFHYIGNILRKVSLLKRILRRLPEGWRWVLSMGRNKINLKLWNIKFEGISRT